MTSSSSSMEIDINQHEINNNNIVELRRKKLIEYFKIRSNNTSSNYSRKFDLPSDNEDDLEITSSGNGAMLPIFLNDLRITNSILINNQINNNNNHCSEDDLVEVTLELDNDAIVVRNVRDHSNGNDREPKSLRRSLSNTSRRIYRKFGWLKRSLSLRSTTSSSHERQAAAISMMNARDERRMRAKLQRTTTSARRALKGLRFISKTTMMSDESEMLRKVEERFDSLAKDGLLAREDFGECIGMDSREFAVGIFDALARRKKQKISKISKEELHEFWLQISDNSFDARLQIFFDMADSNEDGRISREEVQELIILSASANKLAKLKEQAEEYASLIMEELDPENLGYIELWQLETLLLQRDTYMNYSRPLSTASVGWSQNLNSSNPINVFRSTNKILRYLILDNWQRVWILLLWFAAMAVLFAWKFIQYRNRTVCLVAGDCLAIAKGAAETLKLNMALILFPVCRNTLTWIRSTRARSFIPFDDNINFHKSADINRQPKGDFLTSDGWSTIVIIGSAVIIGIVIHAGNHLACDFPRIVQASPEKFSLIASNFGYKKPTYMDLVTGIEGGTGIAMVILMLISFPLATSYFRRNIVKLPAPFNRLTGFNSFWYSHHLFGIVYLLLIAHGTFLYLAEQWYQKTTWMYISAPLVLYSVERTIRACRSEFYAAKILKVSILPGNVFSIIMSKPSGFKYKSGQYIFLQCPAISSFEWHPFSITSAPGDNYLSVHIRIVGDWTQELKRVFTEASGSSSVIGRARYDDNREIDLDHGGQPRLLVDGPYGAPAQDYRNYDVLLLVGLGIGATPFISIIRDLINNTRAEEQMVEAIVSSDDSTNSYTSSSLTPPSSCSTVGGGRKKSQRTTNAHFCWVTREPGSFEWFKGVMDEVAEMDHKGQIELHNYLTSVYEDGDARSTLITMVQALNHAKHGVDIVSGTRVRTHFARPDWNDVFRKIASKHPGATVGVFYCGMPVLAKELKNLSQEMSHKTTTRFEFHKEYF
ncbi:hypothetical protein ACFE04_017778 [Oxalis oulophora]